jgi:hypothetical protein
MPRRIMFKEGNNLSSIGPVLSGYKMVAYEGATFSQKVGDTITDISNPLKSNVIVLGSKGDYPLITGTTSEVILASMKIPANTLKIGTWYINQSANNFAFCEVSWKNTSGGTGNLKLNGYWNTSNSLSGSTLLFAITQSTPSAFNNSSIRIRYNVNMTSISSSFIRTSFTSNNVITFDDYTSGLPETTATFSTFDITVDNWIIVTAQPLLSGDSVKSIGIYTTSLYVPIS